jgi:hypothetical protein
MRNACRCLFLLCYLLQGKVWADGPAWQGVWSGTLGKQAIMACLQDDRGEYYYQRHRTEIALTLLKGDLWQEEETGRAADHPMGEPGDPTAQWQLSTPSRDQIVGRWLDPDNKRTLPIRLQRVSVSTTSDSNYPCAAAEYKDLEHAGLAGLLRKAETIGGLTGATAVASAGNYTCAIVNEGRVNCWEMEHAALGGESAGYPTAIQEVNDAIAVTVASSPYNTYTHNGCALIRNGTVRCWGDELSGRLGNGYVASHGRGVEVRGLSGATSLVMSSTFACALVEHGEVECWGDNRSLQLGNGTAADQSSTPTRVVGLADATALSINDDRGCALLRDGTIECWGGARSSHNHPSDKPSTPVEIPGMHNAIAVAVGVPRDAAEIYGESTCALLNDGRVQCWGRNNVPEFVGNLRGATALEVGGANCAIVDSGHIQCWAAASNGSSAKVVDGISNAISITRSEPSDSPGVDNPYDMELLVEREKSLAPMQAVTSVGVYNHICVLTREQNVLCAGAENSGLYGKVGKISALAGVTALTAGSGYACALLKEGRVKCFNFYAPTESSGAHSPSADFKGPSQGSK